MDSAQGSTSPENVFNHRREGPVFCGITDDVDIGCQRSSRLEHAGQQGASIQQRESFVAAHARATASGENEGGDLRGRAHGAIIPTYGPFNHKGHEGTRRNSLAVSALAGGVSSLATLSAMLTFNRRTNRGLTFLSRHVDNGGGLCH